MESLLRWGIQNADPNAPPPNPAERKDLDPGIIDAILGKPDSVLMKEALAVAVDERRGEDERVQALDDFEMLVEQIDNANNIEKMKMWDPLHGLLTSSSPDGVKMQTLWVVGTAVQNNPSAQSSYLALSPVPTLLSFLSPSVKAPEIRSKAVYALSGLLKHNARAVQQLDEARGWDVLKDALEDSNIAVRRKAAFLLNTLLISNTPAATRSENPSTLAAASAAPSATSQSRSVILHPSAQDSQDTTVSPPVPVHPNSHAEMLADPSSTATAPLTAAAFERHGLSQALVNALAVPTPHGPDGDQEGDADFEEKVVRALHTYVTACGGRLEDAQKGALGAYLREQSTRSGGREKLMERWSLTADEVQALENATR